MLAESSNGWDQPEPDEPDPGAILREAKQDMAAGRYSVALEKVLWCYRYSWPREQPGGAVYIVEAMGCWKDLANIYPPALDEIRRTRDAALQAATSKKGKLDLRAEHESIRHYWEFASINRDLGEQKLTREVFISLDAEDPEPAKRAWRYMRRDLLPLLIQSKEYTSIDKYLDAEEFYSDALSEFLIRSRSSVDLTEFGEKRFTHACATLIALLVVNGHKKQAEWYATKAKIEWGDSEFLAAIDTALDGLVPDPVAIAGPYSWLPSSSLVTLIQIS